jgi:hypothetical protein
MDADRGEPVGDSGRSTAGVDDGSAVFEDDDIVLMSNRGDEGGRELRSGAIAASSAFCVLVMQGLGA